MQRVPQLTAKNLAPEFLTTYMQARVCCSPVISKRKVERRRWWQQRSSRPSETFDCLQILDLHPSLGVWPHAPSLGIVCRPVRQGMSVWISSSLVLKRLVHSSQPSTLVFQTCDVPLLLDQRHCEIRWTVKRGPLYACLRLDSFLR